MNVMQRQKGWLEQLYHATNQSLFLTAMGILHNEQEAEEIVHNVYMKWLERASYYEKKSETEMLSLGITFVKHACYNLLDVKKRHPETSYEIQEEDLEAEEREDALLQILRKEKEDEIVKALECLSEKEKSVLVLRYYHEMSYKEIARELSIKNKTVEVRLRRAKQHLKEVMEHGTYEFRG